MWDRATKCVKTGFGGKTQLSRFGARVRIAVRPRFYIWQTLISGTIADCIWREDDLQKIFLCLIFRRLCQFG